ncbi:hypothetical protein [Hydrogenimonas sp.]
MAEYLIVDPIQRTIDRFVLEGGRFRYDACYGRDDAMPLKCLDGETMPLDEIFEPFEEED